MPKPIQISIPQPCHENWVDMTPSDKGRFCASCQKNVIDFTKASDREIAESLKLGGNLCGRFRKDQLERNLVVPKEKSSLWAATSAAVISFLTIGSHEALAQEPVGKEHTDLKTDGLNSISGIVTYGSYPLSGVKIKNLQTEEDVVSDADGKFIVNVKVCDTLSTYYNEYIRKDILVHDTSPLTIVLNDNEEITITTLRNKTITQTYYTGAMTTTLDIIYDRPKQRTFFGRIFHSIGNWFR